MSVLDTFSSLKTRLTSGMGRHEQGWKWKEWALQFCIASIQCTNTSMFSFTTFSNPMYSQWQLSPYTTNFLEFCSEKKNSKREISIYYHILCKHRSLQNEGAQQLLTSRFLVLRIISLTWQLCACTESSTQERRTYDSMLAFMWKSDWWVTGE